MPHSNEDEIAKFERFLSQKGSIPSDEKPSRSQVSPQMSIPSNPKPAIDDRQAALDKLYKEIEANPAGYDPEVAKFQSFIQSRQASPQPENSSPVEPALGRKAEFEYLLKKVENRPGTGADPDWGKFQAFLKHQATVEENNSGLGSASILPAELSGLNWGACLLNIIWGVAMRVQGGTLFIWMILMMIIPIFPLYLLWKGNEIAWQSRKWDSVAEFIETQQKWTKIGWITLVAVVVLIIAFSTWIFHMVGPLFKGTSVDPFGIGGGMFGG